MLFILKRIMENTLQTEIQMIIDYFKQFSLKSIVDIVIVFILVVKLIDFLSKTRAIHAVKGVAIIYIGKILSNLWGLDLISEFLGYATTFLWVSMVFMFNKELRMLLEGIGRLKAIDKIDFEDDLNDIRIIGEAAEDMSREKIGSLVVIERESPLKDYIDTGYKIDANLSDKSIMLVFENHSRFHDGAMIIKDSRIFAVKCILPLSKSMSKKNTYGTRHRAAVGITEISDAICITTSEETGQISIVFKGIITPVENVDELMEKYKEMHKNDNIKEQVKRISFKDKIIKNK